ncbi:ABC transporter substrate-binding protein [Curvibacter sp. APW13]|uniref:substrate-binding periplasmic protein n=1 Tax=Curvibacter sp. APW13 TaxID=3077236 RepID=UPI0028DE65EC|nr:ABC transporter substrate-binding protein [Curvibacter sp. APW13]MDT8992356.1 ABC transporter substrate-binding protein [Curvibacter sp. APW13]
MIHRLFRPRWALAAAAATLSLAAQAVDLRAYTGDWAPYNFEEGGKVTGIATDVFLTACKQAKLTCSTEMLPWARSYKIATTEPGTLIYTTARKPSREQEFVWVGPLLPRTTWVYVRNDPAIVTKAPSDISKLTIGIVRGEASETDLLAAGLPESGLSRQPTNADVIRLLRLGVIDGMVDTEIGMLWNLKTNDFAPNFMRQAYKLTDEGAYYYALNLNTPPETVKKLQAAVDKLRTSGEIQKVVQRYVGGR